MIIFEVILGIIIAVTFYNFIHHFLVVVPNQKKQLAVKRRVDRVIKRVLNFMKRAQLISGSKILAGSSLLSHVWGRNIFAYDYSLNLSFGDLNQLRYFKEHFQEVLSKYCSHHHFFVHHHDLFIVADVWSYNQKVHVDIAYQINSSTTDYLKDLKRL